MLDSVASRGFIIDVEINSLSSVLSLEEGQNGLSAVGDSNLPGVTVLGKAHPNPFNPSTTIEFSLAQGSHARVDVYSIDGKYVCTLVNEMKSSGSHQISWTGVNSTGEPVASGAYFFRLVTSSGYQQTGRMTLVK